MFCNCLKNCTERIAGRFILSFAFFPDTKCLGNGASLVQQYQHSDKSVISFLYSMLDYNAESLLYCLNSYKNHTNLIIETA